MSLLAELKRRNVIKVGLAYLALYWVAIQVTVTVVPVLNLPESLSSVVVWVGLLGFPFAMVFAWVYELTPGGLKRDEGGTGDMLAAQPVSRKLDGIIIALVILAIALFAWDRFHSPPATSAPQPSETGMAPVALNERPAIAVLPFDNLSTDPEQAIFADGLAEDLITRLSGWRAFPVISRNSSFRFRGGDVDLQQASRDLGARYFVEGSVRRSGTRVRVSAQLIDASSGEHVWANTYDGDVSDVFALQDDLSDRIASSLVADLNLAEGEKARQKGTGDLEAWSLYQLGLQQYDLFTREGFAAARDYFARATEQDPQFATPLANEVFATLWAVVLGWNEHPEEALSSALEKARRAIELDPRDPMAQAALGWAWVMNGDIDNGLLATETAVELNPSMFEAWGWLSWIKLMAGDPQACIDAALRARQLNPLARWTAILNDNLSQAHWELGDFEAGLRAAKRLRAELPDYWIGHIDVAMNAVALGRLDEAREAIDAARLAQPGLSLELVQVMYGVERPEVDARRNAALRQAGLE